MLLLIGVLLLAAGVAAGAMAGWDTPLGAALFQYDPALLNTAQAGIQRYVAPGLWDNGALPLLERPVWLVPAALGVLLLLLHALLQRRRSRMKH